MPWSVGSKSTGIASSYSAGLPCSGLSSLWEVRVAEPGARVSVGDAMIAGEYVTDGERLDAELVDGVYASLEGSLDDDDKLHIVNDGLTPKGDEDVVSGEGE